MRHKAQIKKIYKQDKPPFGDNIYTYKIETTKHTAYYYTSKISFNEGDEVEYDYLQQKNGDYKFKDLKKASMFNNYDKQKANYTNPKDTRKDIFKSVAYKGLIDLINNDKLTIDDLPEKLKEHTKLLLND